MAHFCNPASGRLVVVDDLRLGVLLDRRLRWTGVRTKPGINMETVEESAVSRLPKEERIGPGGKPSSQKHSCRAVVGSRPWVGAFQQPSRYSHTCSFFLPISTPHPPQLHETNKIIYNWPLLYFPQSIQLQPTTVYHFQDGRIHFAWFCSHLE